VVPCSTLYWGTPMELALEGFAAAGCNASVNLQGKFHATYIRGARMASSLQEPVVPRPGRGFSESSVDWLFGVTMHWSPEGHVHAAL
jgi:hypothetical protein